MRTPRSASSRKFAEAEDVGGAVFAARCATRYPSGKAGEISEREAGRARRADAVDQLRLDRRRPAADHFDNRGVERVGVGQRRVFVDILRVADQREVAVAELDRPAGDLARRPLLEHHARWPCGATSSVLRAAARRR